MSVKAEPEKQVRVTLLGTGTPILDASRQHSSSLIEIGEEALLFDCGRGVTSQLARAGIPSAGIHNIFITHHHYDHICDLGEFLMTSWHNGHNDSFFIFGPPGTAEIVSALFDKVFARDINFALFTEEGLTDLRKLLKVKDIAPGLVCDNGTWRVYAEYVNHGNSLGLSQAEWPCMGYRIEAEQKVIAVSGDAVACPGLDKLAHGADCLVQCCYLAESEITNAAFKRSAEHIIASSRMAGKIAADNEVKKLVLTHFRPKSEISMRSVLEDVRIEFAGEVILGQDLTTVEI